MIWGYTHDLTKKPPISSFLGSRKMGGTFSFGQAKRLLPFPEVERCLASLPPTYEKELG
jgi:hypothetical protein